MAKPDMSRNKDLAGKTVSKGGYNISYNENGYATSAIKTGSKTGKAAAPSAEDVYKRQGQVVSKLRYSSSKRMKRRIRLWEKQYAAGEVSREKIMELSLIHI